MLDQKYELLLLNEVLCYVEYQTEGSSFNMFSQYRKNPKGFAFLRKINMQLPFASMSYKFQQAIHYVADSLIGRNGKFFQESPRKFLTLAAILPGVLLYFYIMRTKAASPFKGK